MKQPIRVCLVSLGCPKNLVDSEVIAGRLVAGSMRISTDLEGADAAVINTCGFLQAAREESLETIRQVCRLKKAGSLSAVVVVGCLVQRYRDELELEIPEADAFLPISDYSGVPALLQSLVAGEKSSRAGGRPRSARSDLERCLLTAPHVSYLRIAEGCNHSCSFCAIPAIRGRLQSKPINLLREEARGLAEAGVKEINLVAEDTTEYGLDLGGKRLLPALLRELGQVEGIRWIRILYAYPSGVTRELMGEMAANPSVLPYLDMPLQHINASILKSMRRGGSPTQIKDRLEALRQTVPGIVLRTSVIVGYPGETESAFQELFDFLRTFRFERLGAFLFSPEEGTAAYCLKNRVADEVAEARIERIMVLQQSIIEERNKSLVGTDAEVIVDQVLDKGDALGRTRADAPDIDCAVVLHSAAELERGAVLSARITGYDGYDLLGKPLSIFKPGHP